MIISPGSVLSATPALGQERTGYWRGWPVRYRVLLPTEPAARQRPPVLMLHGFGASLDQWRDNFVALAQHQPLYALDLLGFGGSAKAATRFNIDLWVAQVHDFWTRWLGQRPMIVVGHSLGALVALSMTVAHPKAVERLVLLTLPAAREELLPGWADTLSRPLERWFSTPLLIRPLFYWVRRPGIIRAALRGIYQVPQRVDADLVEQFVAPTRDRGAARTLCYLVRSRTEPQFTPATKDLVHQLTQPTLLLWGEADRVIPLTWGQELVKLSDRLSLVVIPKAGHCLYDEYPNPINQQILSWLQLPDSPPPP
ncbi:alpha/beta fold hydrolase [Leptolyngbya sp. PCC 6406]|uniref:alpha/beta fold hydrolase n=1 Tax=Leptolyngbya sp. PCC 6406 TaxID=1173264 RepID=UPI0002ACCCBD|nr:alpha/beta fold hydrolase [Leptolyngbya sp. PCC 6406]